MAKRYSTAWWRQVRESAAKGHAAYRAKYPERAVAHDAVREGIAGGAIVPQPCDRCGGEGKPVYNHRRALYINHHDYQ